MAAALLIVDDDRSISRTLQLLLKSRGYEADICNSGAEVLQRVRVPDALFTLILMDVRLPDGNGIDVLEQLQPHLNGARVVLMSGYDADFINEDPRASLAHAIYTKPIALDSLWALLQEIAPQSDGQP